MQASSGQFAHMVYFKLKDDSPQQIERMLQQCRHYLSDHPGIDYFAVGTVADANRDVNVRDFHVALHLIFDSRQSHDRYQEHPRHLQFIDENRANWENVRVFDADVTA